MTVSEVPKDTQISPGDKRMPANEAGLSPVNAVTLQPASNPNLSII